MKQTLQRFISLLAAAAAAYAGPPLICHRVEIGSAKSLPWRAVTEWDGTAPGYDLSRLTADTLGLLAPGVPLNVRMETLRRAAVYAVKQEGAADQLAMRLLARAADSEAAGKPEAAAWFDAGYFAEAMRQMAFVKRYDMLSASQRREWKWRPEAPVDGKPWMERAAKLGLKGVEVALAKVMEYREADLKRVSQARP